MAAAPAPGGQQQGGQAQNGLTTFLQAVLRMGIMWYMFNMFKGGPSQQATGGAHVMIKPHFVRGDLLDVRVFVTDMPSAPSVAKGHPVWQVDGVALGTMPEHKLSLNYTLSKVGGVGPWHGSSSWRGVRRPAACAKARACCTCAGGAPLSFIRELALPGARRPTPTNCTRPQAAKDNGTVYLHAVFSVANTDPDARDELPPGSVFTRSIRERAHAGQLQRCSCAGATHQAKPNRWGRQLSWQRA